MPIRLHNTALIRALLYDYDSTMKLSTDFDRLNLTTNPFLEKVRLYGYGFYSYGLRSYGLYSYGLDSHGL